MTDLPVKKIFPKRIFPKAFSFDLRNLDNFLFSSVIYFDTCIDVMTGGKYVSMDTMRIDQSKERLFEARIDSGLTNQKV